MILEDLLLSTAGYNMNTRNDYILQTYGLNEDGDELSEDNDEKEAAEQAPMKSSQLLNAAKSGDPFSSSSSNLSSIVLTEIEDEGLEFVDEEEFGLEGEGEFECKEESKLEKHFYPKKTRNHYWTKEKVDQLKILRLGGLIWEKIVSKFAWNATKSFCRKQYIKKFGKTKHIWTKEEIGKLIAYRTAGYYW